MPSTCTGADLQLNSSLPTALVGTSPAAPAAAATPRCDAAYCEAPNGQVCPPELCGRSGAWMLKVHCPPLLPHAGGGAASQSAAVEGRGAGGKPTGNPDGIIRKRRKAVAGVRPKLDALVRELKAALRANVLAPDEDTLLAILERWAQELKTVPRPPPASRAAKRRPVRRKRR